MLMHHTVASTVDKVTANIYPSIEGACSCMCEDDNPQWARWSLSGFTSHCQRACYAAYGMTSGNACTGSQQMLLQLQSESKAKTSTSQVE